MVRHVAVQRGLDEDGRELMAACEQVDPPPDPVETDGYLGAEGLRRAVERRIERVEIPDAGGHVYVRVMSGTARFRFTGLAAAAGSDMAAMAEALRELVKATACDEAGVELFAGDAGEELLDALPYDIADTLATVAMRVNGLTEHTVEDLAGKSDAIQNADSGAG